MRLNESRFVLPAEISNLLTADNLHAVEEHFRVWASGRIDDTIFDAVMRPAVRKLRAILQLPPTEIDSIRQRLKHLCDVFDGFEAHLRDVEIDIEILKRNVRSQAFEDFTNDAFDIGVRAAAEGKSLLAGRLAAKRAAVVTESMDDLLLREALRITDRANIAQLHALVAVYLVAQQPLTMPGDALTIARQLEQDFGVVLKRVVDSSWSKADLEHLEAIGALRIVNVDFNGPATSRFQRFLDAPMRQPVPVQRVPRTTFSNLAEEIDYMPRRDGARIPEGQRASLRPYEATPAGMLLATTLIDGLRTT